MLFLHVGLHKTATTYLQRDVYPKFRNLHFIRWAGLDEILRMKPDERCLISNERLAGQLWSTRAERRHCIRRLSQLFPDANILISFRRHDKYIDSSYRGYLQRGGTLVFDKYFDIEDDEGFMKKEQCDFSFIIREFEDAFGRMPFVFLQEEVKLDFERLLADMALYFGASAPALSEIALGRRNKGVGYYPARILRALNEIDRRGLSPDGLLPLTNRVTTRLRIDPRSLCQHWLAFLPDRSMIPEAVRQRILDHYRADWEIVQSYQRNRSALLTRAARANERGTLTAYPPLCSG